MGTQRLDSISAAMRLEAAMRSDERTQCPLVYAHQEHEQLGNHAAPTFCSARLRSSINSVNGRERVLSRPISTRSIPCTGVALNSRRAASRRRRRVRLRVTALPTFLVTVNPRRAGLVSSRASACNTRPWTAALRPDLATRRNSARRVSRVETGATTAPAGSGGQLVAALSAAVGQDLAPAHGGHAGAEAVTALADQLGWLVSTLHGTPRKTQRSKASGASPVRRGGL